MIHGLWIAKKNELYCLIKSVSDHCGGDELEWLRDYAKHVAQSYKDSINDAISCFRSLCSGYGQKSLKTKPRAFVTTTCPECGYVPPFCYFYLTKECSNITKNVQK